MKTIAAALGSFVIATNQQWDALPLGERNAVTSSVRGLFPESSRLVVKRDHVSAQFLKTGVTLAYDLDNGIMTASTPYASQITVVEPITERQYAALQQAGGEVVTVDIEGSNLVYSALRSILTRPHIREALRNDL